MLNHHELVKHRKKYFSYSIATFIFSILSYMLYDKEKYKYLELHSNTKDIIFDILEEVYKQTPEGTGIITNNKLGIEITNISNNQYTFNIEDIALQRSKMYDILKGCIDIDTDREYIQWLNNLNFKLNIEQFYNLVDKKIQYSELLNTLDEYISSLNSLALWINNKDDHINLITNKCELASQRYEYEQIYNNLVKLYNKHQPIQKYNIKQSHTTEPEYKDESSEESNLN